MKLSAKQSAALEKLRAAHPGWSDEHLLCTALGGNRQVHTKPEQRTTTAAEPAAKTYDELLREVQESEAALREMGVTLDAPAGVPQHTPTQRSTPTQHAGKRLLTGSMHVFRTLWAARETWWRAGRPKSGPEAEHMQRVVRSFSDKA